jgi:hypothetical protein
LKRLGEIFFVNFITNEEILSFQKISSGFIQYSERTITGTETNDTSKKISYPVFLDGKSEGVALSRGLQAYLL